MGLFCLTDIKFLYSTHSVWLVTLQQTGTLRLPQSGTACEYRIEQTSCLNHHDALSLFQDSHSKSRKSSRTSDYSSSASSVVSPVQPESRLAYGFTFDPALSRLNIRVIQLGNFRVTDPDGALSPYVKIRVYRLPKQFFTFNFKLK